ncbi:MAG: FHA domain-containing protein [Proteobacteria bacterium]|nr:FHA domain-containing protein [Pseudomonadota bacterium]
MSFVCSRCGLPVRPNFKFCSTCGAPVVETPEVADETVAYSPFMGPQGNSIRQMTGHNAGIFFSAYPECCIGREDANVRIADDDTLSPNHMRVFSREDGLCLEDMDSLNGVFLAIKTQMFLQDHDIIRAGDHYFFYELTVPDAFTDEYGTEFYASPGRGERFRLVEILSGGRRGRACMAPDGAVVVGRSDGDFTFPEDHKMSARHFTVRWTRHGGVLIDHSMNGTFLQIHDVVRVEPGDLFFAGRNLFRVI